MEVKLFLFVTVAISQVLCSCRPKDVKLVNFQSRRKRSIIFTVGVTATKCPGLDEFYYFWKVDEKPKMETIQTSTSSTLTVNGYKYHSKTIFENDYLTTLRISHYPDLANYSSVKDTFRFLGDEMHIRILGGSEKTHVFGFRLMVNARVLSRDPSYPPEEDPFVGNVCNWSVIPKIENFTLTDNLVLMIAGNLLKVGTTYNFTVTVTRTKIRDFPDKKTATQLVHVVSRNVSEINIKCIRNCVNPHYLEPTAFAVECSKNCKNLNYKWSITPAIDSKQIDFGNGHDKFLVRENSYKAGDIIRVVVKSSNSHSSASLQFVSGIKKGICDVNPKEGTSGVTAFKVRCSGFSSPYDGIVYMIYQTSEEVEGGVLLNEDSYKEESDVYLTEGAPATLKIKVQDNAYLQEEIELSVQVKPFSPRKNISKSEAIKNLVLTHDFVSVTFYSLQGFSNEVVQMVSFLLNSIKESKEMSNSTIKDLHKHMAESLLRAKILSFTSAIQLLSILTKLQKFKLSVDTSTSRLIGKAVANAAFTSYVRHITEGPFDIPQHFINSFFATSLNLTSEQIKKVEEIEFVLNELTPHQDYDSYDEFVSEKLKITDDLRAMVTYLIISIQTNGITALYKNIPDQKELSFDSELIYFTTKRVLLTSLLLNQTITFPQVTQSKIFIPKPLIEELQEGGNYVDYQFGVFKKNPFWWHRNSSMFHTDFILFDLFRQSYKIRTVKRPFYVHLQTVNIPVGKLKGNLTDKSVAAHRIEVEPGVLLVAVFEPSDETYTVTSSECFCNADDFSRGVAIKKDTNDSQRTVIARPAKDRKSVYVCVMKSGPKLSYEGEFATFSCVYWDNKSGKWKSDGCEVQNAVLQNSSLMVCKCSHVSLFAGQIFVAPNSLNLEVDVDFTIAFLENRLMVAVVGVLVFVWFGLLLLAHSKDRAMKNENVVHKLDDNVPGDGHIYLVVVFTGFFFDAGTTADVAFQLIGDQAKSRIHLIKCQEVTLLKRNSQDWFLVFTPFYLGKLKKISIWHNSKGRKPHWYCVRIIVQDFKSGEQYCFSVNKWFSVIWGNGRTHREIRVKEIIRKNRKILFLTQVESEMRDKHLWMSILVRDAQSNFNSKERVSCAFCFIFLAMLASAMFYGIPLGAPADSIDRRTDFYITFYNVIITLQSWLVATPLGMLIVMLFKNSAPRSF